MKQYIEKLVKESPGAKTIYFEDSGWLENINAEEYEIVVAKYEGFYQDRLEVMMGIYGVPNKTLENNSDEISKWWPEVLQAALWVIEGNNVVLALEHADHETPVAVALRCLTDSEINELSA